MMDVDDSLWQILVGSDTSGWRDITHEAGNLTYSNVRPGGPSSCSFTVSADVWGVGLNELRPDQHIVVRYAGIRVWSGFALPRSITYQGE